MQLHGSLFIHDDEIQVRHSPAGPELTWIRLGTLTVHLTPKQATKLCFDLLGLTPPVAWPSWVTAAPEPDEASR